MNVQRLPALGPYRKPLQIISHPHTIFFFTETVYYNVILRRFRVTIVAVEKQ